MKTALVFEGGASRALFTCGVIDVLLENNIRADYLIGVSAGISYGIDYAAGQAGRSLRLATEYMHDKRYMGVKYLIDRSNRSIYNIPFAFRQIPDELVPFDYEAFRSFPGEIYAGVTNLETGLAEYISVPRDREGSEKLLRASCALPILFQPQEYNGKLYMDGGISDSIPFQKAVNDGCDRVIVILTRERGFSKTGEKSTPLVKRIYKDYPQFMETFLNRPDMYNRTLNSLAEYEKAGKALVIAPRDTSGYRRTERNPEKLREIYGEGRREALAALDKIREYLK